LLNRELKQQSDQAVASIKHVHYSLKDIRSPVAQNVRYIHIYSILPMT